MDLDPIQVQWQRDIRRRNSAAKLSPSSVRFAYSVSITLDAWNAGHEIRVHFQVEHLLIRGPQMHPFHFSIQKH
jgi:hypothetical protein